MHFIVLCMYVCMSVCSLLFVYSRMHECMHAFTALNTYATWDITCVSS